MHSPFRCLYGVFVCLSLLLTGLDAAAQTSGWFAEKAAAFAAKKETDSALYFYKKAEAIYPQTEKKSIDFADFQSKIGALLYQQKSSYQEAQQYFKTAGEIILLHKGFQSEKYADNLFIQGQLYYLLRQTKQAKFEYNQAKEIYASIFGKENGKYAGMCNALGILYNDGGDFSRAAQEHQSAMEIRRSLFGEESLAFAQSCNNLAAVYWSMGLLEKAEPLAQRARALRASLPKAPPYQYAISCVNLGNVYRDMGKYDQALELYLEAKKIRIEVFGHLHQDVAQSCDILSNLYSSNHNMPAAIGLLLEAKAIRDSLADSATVFYGQNCSNLAEHFNNIGDKDLALQYATRAYDIFHRIGKPARPEMTIVQNLLGKIFFQQKNWKQSFTHLENARKAWLTDLGKLHPFYIDNGLNLARLYAASGKPEKAQSYYRQAFHSQQSLAQNLFSFTSESEKKLFLDHILDSQDEFLSFAYRHPMRSSIGLALEVSQARKGQVLASVKEMLASLRNNKDTAVQQRFDTWIALKKQIASIAYRHDEFSRGYEKKLRVSADSLEKLLSISQVAKKKSIALKNPQRLLRSDEAVVVFEGFHFFDGFKKSNLSFYAALVLQPGNKQIQLVDLSDKVLLDSLVTKSTGLVLQNSRGVRKMALSGNVSQAIYRNTWKPLSKLLSSYKHIFLLPGAVLNQVAFAALPVDSLTVLGDQYHFTQLASLTSLLLPKPQDISTADITVFGAINYGTRSQDQNVFFEDLPGAAKEVKEIIALAQERKANVTAVSGVMSTETAFCDLSKFSSPSIIHIATHGFYLPYDSSSTKEGRIGEISMTRDPMFRSGLVFSGANTGLLDTTKNGGEDGILTAYEISGLELRNTKLVVLSACETALGDIDNDEGVYGLQRAFKMAGVQYLIMSLWQVPDAETSFFMKTFYNKFFDSNNIETAFFEAQQKLKKFVNGDTAKWGAWVLLK